MGFRCTFFFTSLHFLKSVVQRHQPSHPQPFLTLFVLPLCLRQLLSSCSFLKSQGKSHRLSVKASPRLSRKEFIFSSFASIVLLLLLLLFGTVTSFGGTHHFVRCYSSLHLSSLLSRHLILASLSAVCPGLGTSLGLRKCLVNRAFVFLLLLLPGPCF